MNSNKDYYEQLHEYIERLRANYQDTDVQQKRALYALVKYQSNVITRLEEQLLEAETDVKNAARYLKLRNLEWDSDSHPELWDALNRCPAGGEYLDKVIDETL